MKPCDPLLRAARLAALAALGAAALLAAPQPPPATVLPESRVVRSFVLYPGEPAEAARADDDQPPTLRWEVVGTEVRGRRSGCEPAQRDDAGGASVFLTVVAVDRSQPPNTTCVHWPLRPQGTAEGDLKWLEWTDGGPGTRVLLGWGDERSPIWRYLRVRGRELGASVEEFGREVERPRPQVFAFAPGAQPFTGRAGLQLEPGQVLKIAAADPGSGVERLEIATSEIPPGRVVYEVDLGGRVETEQRLGEGPAGDQEGRVEVEYRVGATTVVPAEDAPGGRVGVRFELGEDLSVRVPRLVGGTLAAARESMAGLGLKLAEPPETRAAPEPAGTVLEQQPAPDAAVAAGAEIRVVVSSGPGR